MSLSKTQQEFTRCIGALIEFAADNGIGLTMGDAYRDPRVHGDFGVKKSYSASRSCHKVRLASDFNAFVDGKYISDGTHWAYIKLGEYWETLHPDARWGGRFGDGNHFSFEYQGVK